MTVVLRRRQKGASWKVMESAGERDQYTREMWEYLSCERSKVKKFREDAEKEKQEGIQGQWQSESAGKVGTSEVL